MPEDITINGNTLVSADATLIGNATANASGYMVSANAGAFASANAYLNAGGDIDLNGDVTVTADATLTGTAFANAYGFWWDSANAGAFTDAYAYLNAGGDITVTCGDISVTANANAASASDESGSAYAGLFAGGDITVYYPTHAPRVYAPSFGDPAHAFVQQMESGSDSVGSNYFATLEIVAGGVVTGGLRHCEVEGIDEARLLSTLIDDSYETASLEPGEDGPFEVGDDSYVDWAQGAGNTAPQEDEDYCDQLVTGRCLPPK